MRVIAIIAALALTGCAVARVPVKVAGTAVGVTAKTVGEAVMIVTRDTQRWD